MAESDTSTYPLQGFRGRPGAGMNHSKPWLPEVQIVVGRDTYSSGLTVTAWEDAGGQYPRLRTLFSARWSAPLESTEEALRIAIRGLTAALDELLSPDE